MRLLISLGRKYPWQSLIMLLALLLAGVAEGVGLSGLLPLISIAIGKQTGAQGVTFAGSSGLERTVTETLAAIGLSPTLGVLLTLITLAITLKGILILLAKKRIGYTVAQIATDLRLSLLRSLLVTKWEYYIRQPVGVLTNAMATEANRTSKAYSAGITMIAYLIQAIVYACVAVLVSWRVTLLAVAVGLFLVYLLSHLVKKARRAGLRQTELMKSLLTHLTNILLSIKPIKAMARERRADALLEKKTNRLNKALRKVVLTNETLKASQEPLLIIFAAIGLYAALTYWHMALAKVMVLTFLLVRLVRQLNKVQEQYQQMAISESAYWSLKETIHEAERTREPALGSVVPSLNHGIRLDRVSFAYDQEWVLRDASFDFPSGLFTAIVGPSGVGKTTVADLVIGLLRPQEGEIFIDDLPLAEVDLRRWRKMIGYVPQETLLLHDTVLTNVTLGDAELTEADAEESLRAAGAWEFVRAMPVGMHSTVGERGSMLSGGQRQRIAIARALVHKPKLLILDEPTSALDPESETAICETLGQLRGRGITILAISHQPTMMDVADRAYQLQDDKAFLLQDHKVASAHSL
ncbi:MAG: ABC transporter ATP-binding protein [Deltaproteobacteria bacterium]|jgi:ATP-binding cassette subfamily C protein